MIDSDEKLAGWLSQIEKAPWLSLDTEADSLHAYPEKLCLMQVGLPGEDILIDPLSNMRMEPLLQAFSRHELIMHGADYDLRLLRKTFSFTPTAIFDTMIAARLLGAREFGLGNLVFKHLRVTLEKGPQKANWGRRPLTPRMEAYARNDTRHLKPLADILKARLIEMGRLSWHQESCARLIQECALFRPVDPDMLWRVKGSHQLSPRELALLRELWHWREKEAVKFNRPPHFVLSSETLVDLAEAAAESGVFEDIIPSHLTSRRRLELQQAIQKGLEARNLPNVLRPVHHRQTAAEKNRMNELERRRNARAEELGIDPTLIASRAMLVMLARDWNRHQGDLMNWQRMLLS